MPVRTRVALCVLHGIGVQQKDWADRFVTTVRRTVARLHPEIDVYPVVVWWAPITQRYEDRLVSLFRRGLGWNWLRRLVIDFGGDVIAYQSPSQLSAPPSWTYRIVHERIDRRLRALRATLEQTGAAEPSPVPLVVVAHSLGSVIFSDFVYDLQTGQAAGAFARRYGLAIRALYTAGSPLALYAIRYPKLGFDRPISLDGGTWVNVLYKADVIAYPLRRASPAYADAVAEDWMLPARWWPPVVYRTPYAHLAYWSDHRFIRRVAADLVRTAQPTVG
ncbi:MAG: hypothetical protein ACREMW_06000 [Gemmatimonadales bacterium]